MITMERVDGESLQDDERTERVDRERDNREEAAIKVDSFDPIQRGIFC
jgi:hypothetical protein